MKLLKLKASCSAQSEFSSLLQVSCPESRSSVDNSSLQWIPPPANLVKFNCDGAFKRGAAAIGVIGRKSDGKLVVGRGCCVSATSPLQSELIAIREACLIIRHHHLFNACIESDCKSAISFCSTESTPPWDSAVLIEDIRSIVATFHIRILFVPRSCNGAAHWVAHQACLKNLPPNWVFDPPDQLSSLLRSDSVSCS